LTGASIVVTLITSHRSVAEHKIKVEEDVAEFKSKLYKKANIFIHSKLQTLDDLKKEYEDYKISSKAELSSTKLAYANKIESLILQYNRLDSLSLDDSIESLELSKAQDISFYRLNTKDSRIRKLKKKVSKLISHAVYTQNIITAKNIKIKKLQAKLNTSRQLLLDRTATIEELECSFDSTSKGYLDIIMDLESDTYNVDLSDSIDELLYINEDYM
jgi:hypothetical protein